MVSFCLFAYFFFVFKKSFLDWIIIIIVEDIVAKFTFCMRWVLIFPMQFHPYIIFFLGVWHKNVSTTLAFYLVHCLMFWSFWFFADFLIVFKKSFLDWIIIIIVEDSVAKFAFCMRWVLIFPMQFHPFIIFFLGVWHKNVSTSLAYYFVHCLMFSNKLIMKNKNLTSF